MINILFVCLGNICRSPMAEGIFQQLVADARLHDNFSIDSAGTSAYHKGERADPRMRSTAGKHGIVLHSRARQLLLQDFERFEYILAMDRSNLEDIESLRRKAPEPKAEVLLMRQFDPEGRDEDVPDPYFGGEAGFDQVYAILERSGARLLHYLRGRHAL